VLSKELVRKELQLDGCESEISFLKEKLDLVQKREKNVKEK
jgi:hypothetical protein